MGSSLKEDWGKFWSDAGQFFEDAGDYITGGKELKKTGTGPDGFPIYEWVPGEEQQADQQRYDQYLEQIKGHLAKSSTGSFGTWEEEMANRGLSEEDLQEMARKEADRAARVASLREEGKDRRADRVEGRMGQYFAPAADAQWTGLVEQPTGQASAPATDPNEQQKKDRKRLGKYISGL